jgi:hypothetical protein
MIWIDITNLPHVLFFKDFIRKHNALVTARQFGELTNLLDTHEIEYVAVGKHGGKKQKDKLVESSKRVMELADIISRHDIKVAISKHSVELPRVAYGLGIPTIQIVDNEHAEEQNRLVLPLCSRIVIPKVLDHKRLLNQGATLKQMKDFKGVCEVVHVKNFRPDKRVLNELGLENYVLIRPEPYMAAYFKSEGITKFLVDRIAELGLKAVVVPRGNETFENAKIIKGVDTLSLIYYAKAFLGGGGTMNRESALLGTPVISFYPQDLLGVDRFLIKHKLLFHSIDVDEIIDMTTRLIEKKQELRDRAKKLVRKLENPFEVIEKEIHVLHKHYPRLK